MIIFPFSAWSMFPRILFLLLSWIRVYHGEELAELWKAKVKEKVFSGDTDRQTWQLCRSFHKLPLCGYAARCSGSLEILISSAFFSTPRFKLRLKVAISLNFWLVASRCWLFQLLLLSCKHDS